MGEIELEIPRLRTGSDLPLFWSRAGALRALVAVVQEAYVNGVSTRKVDRLVEQMGLRGLSKDQVSRMCRGLDDQVQAFRERPLEGPTPTSGSTRRSSGSASPAGVRQKALVIAYAVHESGRREVLGLDVGEAETEAFWAEFLFSLKARGLTGIRLCVSDAHQGLRNAIARVLGCRWQRCSVHFLRDMLGHCARTQQPMIATAIRQIFQVDTGQQARERLVEVTDRLRLQVELFNRRRWKTRIELATAIHDYIEHWHNTRRRHSALGILAPTEYEKLHHDTNQAA